MRTFPDLLFFGTDLSQVLSANIEQAKKEVDEIPQNQFVHSSDQEIVDHVFSNREVIPLLIHGDQMTMEAPQETQVDVSRDPRRYIRDTSRPFLIPGVRVSVRVPFEGDPELWRCQTSRSTLNPPRANVHTGDRNRLGFLEIVGEWPCDTEDGEEAFKRELDSALSSIRDYLEWSRKQVEGHNNHLQSQIKQAVEHRRQRLGKHADIAKTLNIPLREKPGAPRIEPLPIKRKLIRPLPPVPNSPPEPGIRTEDYEHILSVIRHEGRTFETTPKTYSVHDEEELRDIILAHLNGHYEGDATGETFRGHGKTDIRVEAENRAAFVGECKVWRGQKEIGEALDQLLGYLTWRDCKAAIVVFNKHVAGFSGLQEKLPETLKSHSNLIKPISINESGEWRFLFRSKDDEERHITVHVFLFNLFVNQVRKSKKEG